MGKSQNNYAKLKKMTKKKKKTKPYYMTPFTEN